MSLGIVFKGPEGIVLAADSRVTLTTLQIGPDNTKNVLSSSFDNATKLLNVSLCSNVGVVTYGMGAIGNPPRTAHSYMSEFETTLKLKDGKIKTEEFALSLSDFFMAQWGKQMPPATEFQGPDMVFLIAGYDEKPYGKVFEVDIPRHPQPKEWHKDTFGPVWGGQQEIVVRLLRGFDPALIPTVKDTFKATDEQMQALQQSIATVTEMRIPYPFLPLQDCIDLSILLIRTTIELQKYHVGIRGVGGSIDVATITKTGGFQPCYEKGVARLYRKENKK